MQASVNGTGQSRFVSVVALLLCAAIPHGVYAQAPPVGVFTKIQTAIAPRISPALEPATIRSRMVQVDTQKITAARRGREALKLNLFDDEVVEIAIKRVRPTRTGYFISGTPEGKEWGEVRLVVNGPVMVGTVVTPEGEFTIRSAGNGRHVIRQIDPAKKPFECGVEDTPTPARSLNAISSIDPLPADALLSQMPQVDELPTEDGSEIRVLIVYTPALQVWQGGAAGMRALIDLMIQSANQSFEDGGIKPRLVLAHSTLVDYVAQTARTDLTRLRDQDDGHMDEIHTLRNKHAADLVHLLTESTPGPLGSADRIKDESLRYADSESFAVTANAHEETFIHEIGHNLGLRHDRYVDTPAGAIYPYAFGYVNRKAFEPDASIESRWRTVMAYNNRCYDAGALIINCRSLLRFSNPDQTHLGDPLGVPADDTTTGPDGPADARLTINNSSPWVGSFRSWACTDFFVSPETSLAPVGGGEIVLKVEAGPGCLWEAKAQAEYLTIHTEMPVAGSNFLNLRIDANQSGAERSATLSVAGKTITVRQLATSDGVCGRTSAVMETLSRVAGFSGASQCDQVTEVHLESISTLKLNSLGLKSLKQGDFEGLDALTILNLSSNQLTDLPAGLFKGLSSLEHLFLSHNQLSALPSSLFAELPELKHLILSNNQLKNLPEGQFAGLSNLEELRLGYNTLTRLPEGLFSDLSDLEQLYLFDNQIAELPADMFAGLSKLQQLYLGSNPFTSLPDGIFTDLSRLEILSLWNGSVIELPASVFAGLSSLRDLDLTLNPLTELPDGIFADLPMLERLILWGSSLTELRAGVFAHLSRLRILDLNENDLSDLPEDIFAGLSSLERLVLSRNQLAGLPAGVFAHLSHLRDLDLLANDLSDLPADIFAGLSSLERLVLGRNQLAGLPIGIFSGLGSLKELRLERNTVDPLLVLLSLKKVGNSQFKAIAPVGAPFNLVLEANANEGGALEDAATTVTIPAGALESEPIGVLRKEGTGGAVNVDISVLPSLPSDHSGYFLKKDEDLPRWILASDNPADASLIDLSLNGGELEPDFSPETSKYTVSVANALSKTTITPTTSNPGASVTFLGASEQTLEDADPDVEGQQVNLIVGDNTIEIAVTAVDGVTTERYTLTVTREENNCDRTAQALDAIVEAIPGVDECGYLTAAHLSGITKLDLSGRGIASLQPGDFGGLTGLESLWLYDNQLSDLPDNIFSGLPALHTLLLSDNQLEDLPVDIFSELSSLRLLSLNSNQLRLLPLGIFSGLTRLESLWLSGNQLTSLPVDLFSGLSRLQVLLLGDNNLQSLPADLFKGLDTLGTLWIQHNELGSLPENLFSGLSVLELLGLGGNQLSSLPVGVFSDLAELQILHLNHNRLTSVPENLFSGLSALESLGLQGNQLSSLPAGVFAHLSRLRDLNLYENDLSDLPADIFAGLSSLERLVLGGNQLAGLPAGVFAHLSRLTDLNLAGNVLSDLPADIFAGLSSLERLVLSRNQLAGLPTGIFSGLGSLKELRLDQNTVDPMPVLLSLEKVGNSQFKAVSATGAPFALELLVSVNSAGTIEGGATSLTIPAGALESAALRLTRVAGTVEAVQVDVGALPSLPHNHDGYVLEKDAGLPLEIPLPEVAVPPEQVTGVEVTISVEEIGVSWVENSEADGYKVQWKSGAEEYGEERQAVVSGGDVVNYTITGLTAGTEYSIRVIATRENADDGPPSEEVTGTPLAMPASQVQQVEVTAGIEQLEVSWDVVSGADGYKVQWKSGTGDYDEARQVALPGGDTTRYTIMDLTADTQYTIRVIATKEHGDDGAPSEEVTATPVSTDPDVNSDGMLDGNDALILYHTYASANQLGDGETGGTAESRESLLAGYSGKDDPTDDELKAMIRKANAWKDVGVDAGGDINEDGAIDGDDAVVMYYAYTTENLVGDGETGGTERFRRLLLAAYASQENPTDEDLKAMLRRANKLREEFG